MALKDLLEFFSLRMCFGKRSKKSDESTQLPSSKFPPSPRSTSDSENGSNTSIVIAHGAFHTTWHYENFRSALLKHPQISRVLVPQQCSSGPSPPADSYARDVYLLRQTINTELQSGQDVLLLGHSYGGIPGCDALSSLPDEKSSTSTHCDTPLGRTLGIVFISAFVAEEGQSLITSKPAGRASWVAIEGPLCHVLNPAATLYNQVQPESYVNECVSRLTKQAAATFMAEVQYAPWKEDRFPVAYVHCEKDQAMALQEQKFYSDRLREKRSKAHPPHILSLPEADHSPFASMPSDFADQIANDLIPKFQAELKQVELLKA